MLELEGRLLTLEEIEAVASGSLDVALSSAARARMESSRQVVERILAAGSVVYGVNTGFGRLSDEHIDQADLRRLQLNLVRSHSCGLGDPMPEAEVRAMMLLRANVLATGLCGVRPLLAETILAMLQAGVCPVVPEIGSVGASGDLAPLAHLALCAIGEGGATSGGDRMAASQAMKRARIEPLELEAKEGLALVNGTQAMAAVGSLALCRARRLAALATASGAMSLEALKGTPTAFDERIHLARPHPGQNRVAGILRKLLEGSEIRESHREGDPRVQDAYSLRCMPQVHGAFLDAIEHCARIVEIETGSATDNPLVFADSGELLSGGNFHGAPLALAFDYAAIALADLMSICERRIDRLVNPDLNEGLPPFLCPEPGAGSGLMIAHVAAVALLAEAKVLAHPASVDNLPTSGGKEDHVSMGMTSALKLRKAVGLAERVVAIELLAASEGLEFRKPLRPGLALVPIYTRVRDVVPPVREDRPLSADIELLAASLGSIYPLVSS